MFDKATFFIRQNAAKLVVAGIMVAVSVGIVGSVDIEAIARGRGH